MITPKVFDELVTLLGDEDKAKAAIQLMDKRVTAAGLTEKQKRVYQYLCSGGPLVTQQQVALACGFDHPQKLAPVLTALVMKGFLIPSEKAIDN